MRLSPGLHRYFAGVFLLEIEVDGDGLVEDFVFPDWATFRFSHAPPAVANPGGSAQVGGCQFSVAGPRTQEIYLRTGSVRQWGAVIHPSGWAELIGEPADRYTNGLFDGRSTPAFEKFRPLAETLFGQEADPDGEFKRLTSFFEAVESVDDPAVDKIAKIHIALFDPEIETVAQLGDRVGLSRRTLERLCKRAFGFAPKMVLRRHRFMRSLARFTLDPSLKWIGAMDPTYHDQAQFVRDFHEFMGMTPTQYHQLAKPVSEPMMRERVLYLKERAREWVPDSAWPEDNRAA
ncbi:AraC family transcriptional regulator [Novosphingobium endophyticum]|nr:helix-turn-helix domain-containing protein [Novosphingobium endophyticum]